MATDAIELTRLNLKTRVGEFMGYGRTAWEGNTEETVIEEVVDEGLRRFYYPLPLNQYEESHRWSFLSPMEDIYLWASKTATASALGSYDSATGLTQLTIAAGTFTFDQASIRQEVSFDTTENVYRVVNYTSGTVVDLHGDADAESATDTLTITSGGNYLLPEYFGSLDGRPTFFTEDTAELAVDVVGEQRIRHRRQFSYSSGEPREVAVRPLPFVSGQTQRWELMVWPVPDTAYRMSYTYNVAPVQLADSDYPLGGKEHTQTILESCLAAAELRAFQEAGVHTSAFMSLLASSISLDRQKGGGDVLGDMNVPRRQAQIDLADVRHRSLRTNVTVTGVV